MNRFMVVRPLKVGIFQSITHEMDGTLSLEIKVFALFCCVEECRPAFSEKNNSILFCCWNLINMYLKLFGQLLFSCSSTRSIIYFT
ncbi:hypothetical protein L1987_04339 [Smallanthus sonchifolius]|uniref:Uncharacterized protein n=1 Tax=Smallanthus sonchifolius TaxID=185202 RepID=A0ACB9KD64_9ASTR|nr:hypothetical protein L1987_04339 [Smallanthus sonchifolius]